MNNQKIKIEHLEKLELPKNDKGYILDNFGNAVHYSNNPNLSYPNLKLPLTKEHFEELYRCSTDIFYFIENYVKIFTLDNGWIFPELRDYQIEMIKHFQGNRFCNVLAGRQSGKSVTTLLYLLWKIIFEPNTIVGIAANKGSMAQENISRLREYFEVVPVWMKPGVLSWNKTYFILENGSKVYSEATSDSAFRGKSLTCVFLDELAFVECFEELSKSLLPTLSSGSKSQAIYTSTPKGLNHWYEQWKSAESGLSQFKNFKVDWHRVPGRDENWRAQMIATLPGGEIEFNQEYACEFLGSSKTLVDISILQLIENNVIQPLERDKFLFGTKLYEYPIENHKYSMSVDAAKDGQDNYAIHVVDITNFPFKQVFTGKFNVSHLSMPEVLNNIGTYYNTAFIIAENNEGGGQSNIDILSTVYEYENMFKETKSYYGFRTTAKTRPKILSILKTFLEKGHLKIVDKDTVKELFTFVDINGKYQADKGYKDDLVMSLAITFAPYLNLDNIEDYKEFLKFIEESRLAREAEEIETMGIVTFGGFDDGTNYKDIVQIDWGDNELKDSRLDYIDELNDPNATHLGFF